MTKHNLSEDNPEPSHYKQAGVDIDAGNQLVARIGKHVKPTHRNGVMSGLGGFGGLFDLKATGYSDPVLVSATDGVGTKLKLAHQLDQHDTIGIDLVAMCVNDLIVQGAEPLFFLDYFACGTLNVEQAESVIAGIAQGCEQSGCALIGGETAEMPGMYQTGDYDLAGFAVGAVERDALLPSKHIKKGDVVLGLASSGIHSNGYSLVRKLVKKSGVTLHEPAPYDTSCSLGESLLTPTKLYVASCLNAIKTGGIKALAHITGGGLTENIPRILPDNLAVSIDLGAWTLPPVFEWLRSVGTMPNNDMLLTFNCGIGMIVIVNEEQASEVSTAFTEHGETVFTLGKVTGRTSDPVIYQHQLNA